ncbi:zinc finger protein 408 isoform X2 [Thalassophryne amazonica]|uniref:zinc finger protein 408 isoform X2 n=1 Tax=Thalassophryne amazonica TaxID=390379 RepID=UPI00147116D1|nr:zinc finger protein 408 isoform X2 [Thalassophryne amazonica]
MATLASPIPPYLTSLLSTLLPRGFAVGPSQLCEGRLGLWWVGCSLEAGSLLGKERDTGWALVYHSDPLTYSKEDELTMTSDLLLNKTGHPKRTNEEKMLMSSVADPGDLLQKAAWISFACQARSRAQQNVAVQCACEEGCVGECVDRRLRVCRDIHAGTELLLYEDSVGQRETRNKPDLQDITNGQHRGGNLEINKELKIVEDLVPAIQEEGRETENIQDERTQDEQEKKHRKTRRCIKGAHLTPERGERNPEDGRQMDSHTDLTVVMTDSVGGHRNAPHSIKAAVVVLSDRDRDFQASRAPPPVRCSSRLAAKPRRVHSLATRVKHSSPCQIDGTSRSPADAAETATEDIVTMETEGAGVGAVAGETVAWQYENRERRYRCSSCTKSFFQLCHLKKHQFTHTDIKPFSCQYCGKNYSSAESYKAHELSHRGERPFSCPHCEKSYGLKRDLKEHMVLHTGEKPYVCNLCGKAFARRPSLRIHRLHHCKREMHSQPQKVQCTVCFKLLANAGSLKNHMKVHTGEKPYICQHCGKAFRQRGYILSTKLRRHIKSSHLKEKPYSCHCGASYTGRQSLLRHQAQHKTEGGTLEKEGGQGQLSALGSNHPRPIRGRPKKSRLPQTSGVKEAVKGEQRGGHENGDKPVEVSVDEVLQIVGSVQKGEVTGTNEARDIVEKEAPGHIQEAVVYMNNDSMTTPSSAPLLLTSESMLHGGAEQDLVEVMISESGEQCIVVQGQATVGELLILQEESGLCSVAQTVEINTA